MMAEEDPASQSEEEYDPTDEHEHEHEHDPVGHASEDDGDEDETEFEGSGSGSGSGMGTLTERLDEPCDYDLIEELEELDQSTDGGNEHVIVGKTTVSTSQYITKLEKTHVLGWRSQQIKSGAPPMIRADETFEKEVINEDGTVTIIDEYAFENGQYPLDTYKIAEAELRFGRCPIIIGRPLPNGEKILIAVSKLKQI